MQRFLLAKRAWVVLFAAVCVAFLYGLGAVPLLGPDEPRYAQVAREMFARGDWVTPTLGGHTWFEKPALLYWMMIAAFRVFGVTEFAARVGPALAGVLTVFLTGWMARRAEFESGERQRGFGIACAAVMGSTLGLIVFGRAASFDVLLTATVAASLGFFYASEVERNEHRRSLLLAGFYACVGASVLAKGLVGVVIPCGVVCLYFVLRRRWPGLRRLRVFSGTLLALMVAATWYGPVMARHGRVFVEEFFIQHHFARYVSDKYHHPQPFYFYLPITLALALPWTFFLLTGIMNAFQENARAEDATSKLRVLALAWLILPVLFFSASGSKLPGYVLPVLPAVALLAGDGVHRYLRGLGAGVTMRLTGLLALAFVAAGVAICFFHTGKTGAALRFMPKACAVALVLPSAVAGFVALFLTRRRTLCVASVAVATLLTVVLIVACALGPVVDGLTMGQAFAEARARGLGSLPVVQLHEVERTAEFYAAGRLAYDAKGEPLKLEGAGDVEEFARHNGGSALVIVPVKEEYQLTQDSALETSRVADNGSLALDLVQARSQ